MSTTDLRDQLVRAIYDAIPDDDPRDPKPPLAEHVALPWIERDVDAVLAVVAPLIAREKAEAWEEGHSWGWADYEDHATTMTLDLDGMPSRAEASTMRNPYEKEADRGE